MASIFVYNEPSKTQGRNSCSMNEVRTFMSSKIKSSNTPMMAKPVKALGQQEAQLERENNRNDKELDKLLKSSNLIEQFNASQLEGKDRRNYLKRKVAELGGKPELTSAARAPKPIRLGMEKKTIKLAHKKLQDAKDMGLYHASVKHIYKDPVLAKKPEVRRKADSSLARSSVGKFKNGVLNISKRDIALNSTKDFGAPKRRKIGSVSNRAGSLAGMNRSLSSSTASRKKTKKRK